MWIQKVPGGGICGLAYSPDGRTLFVADNANTFTAWDPTTREGRQLFRFTGGARLLVSGLLAAGGLLVVKSHVVAVHDADTGAEVDRLAPRTGDIHLLPGGADRFGYWSADGRALMAWEPYGEVTGAVAAGPFPASVRAFDLAPDGRTAAVVFGLTRHVDLYQVTPLRATGRFTVRTEYGFVWGVRFAADGRTLAVSCGKQLHLWDVATRTRRAEPVTIDNKYGDATFAFCPHANAFVALNKQRVLTLYSSETGDAIRSLDFALGRNVTCVAFSPDGLTCAVGGSNKQFAVFDVDV